ncbi:hypothetical protein KC19_11G120600 [Ceratodon purpureus]|uniref:Metallo-beta-lactamase domain-containing protein n=1 Tax=Ceratodon purpureus TaxID=3225 RepID=A0A8T0GHT7_CERPU|nr:hypothetical protein KC19_11G120600 [Ceratodon purpureus]
MGSESVGKEHHTAAGGFRNPWPSYGKRPSFLSTMKFFMFEMDRSAVSEEVKQRLGAPLKTNLDALANPPVGALQATWVGHATFLLQFDKLNVLTDPIWSDRCSPSTIVGPKRFMPVPFPIKDLPPVDVVIISHNHYDHLDEATVRALGNKPLYLVPLGIKSWFTSLGITNVVELDWWQEHQFSAPDGDNSKTLRAVCTPCQHFSGRGILDRDKTLWCSWVLESPSKKVYFGGDTGFCSVTKDSDHPGGDVATRETISYSKKEDLPVCPSFAEIGKRFGPFDLACLPIGAYSPRHFMSSIHCSPEDAVAIHIAVNAKRSIGMHWGTFKLTDEAILEPPLRVEKVWFLNLSDFMNIILASRCVNINMQNVSKFLHIFYDNYNGTKYCPLSKEFAT